jgi:hypothetical protein
MGAWKKIWAPDVVFEQEALILRSPVSVCRSADRKEP